MTDRTWGEWNAYVVQGDTRAERRRRLAEVPDPLRDRIRRHVETYFELRRDRERIARLAAKRPPSPH